MRRDDGVQLRGRGTVRFYGRLEQPLEFLGVDNTAPDTYLVRYRFKAPNSPACNGRAIVTTTSYASSVLISRINALGGC
jgi:hypothetical protein